MKQVTLVLLMFGAVAGAWADDGFELPGAVSPEVYEAVCRHSAVHCEEDELEGRVQARVTNAGGFAVFNAAMIGAHPWDLSYIWVSGRDMVRAEAAIKTLYGSWKFVDRAAIYVGKQRVAELSGRARRDTGYYNSSARTHELVERVSGMISLDAAEQIASAEEAVTIRFYGDEGYSDVEVKHLDKLMPVVDLALNRMPADPPPVREGPKPGKPRGPRR